MDESNKRRRTTASDDNNDLRINNFPDGLVEYDKYDTLANTIKIEDITSNKEKQDILRQLKEDELEFIDGILSIGTKAEHGYWGSNYCPNSTEELAWLGYYIGRCTKLKHLYIFNLPPECYNGIEVFRKGLGNNESIETIVFSRCNLINGEGLTKFQILDQFLTNKGSNLNKIDIRHCQLGPAAVSQLSLAIGSCINKSMKSISFYRNTIGNGHLVDIITAALSISPQLEVLRLGENNLGINDCTALSTLLRSTTQLQKLDLRGNMIDNKGVKMLVQSMSNGNTLQYLDLGANRSITIKGWKKVATLLASPSCKLEYMYADCNGTRFGDKGALVFANALAENSTLKRFDLSNNLITTEGWAHFLQPLCDTSSINKIYLSNHTLTSFSVLQFPMGVPDDVKACLRLNSSSKNKRTVATWKILEHHSHFNIEPFSEWEIKVLPFMIKWFSWADCCTNGFKDRKAVKDKIKRMKLSVMYDFIKEFPMLYIEPVTRKEIEEYTALEQQKSKGFGCWLRRVLCRGEQHRLEEIQQRKARAMRRLY